MTEANENRAASATWLTGLVFSALAVPLAMFGAEPLDASLGKVKIRGTLDDYAVQYLGAAAVISLGVGASRLRKRSSSSQKAVADSNSIQHPSASIESLMDWADSDSSLLTEASLKASGLHMFLEEDDAPMVVRSASVDSSSRSAETSRAVQLGEAQSQEPNVAQQSRAASEQVNQAAEPNPIPDNLASIVAEVQSIVQQVAAQSQDVVTAQGATSSVAQQPAHSASKPAVRVAALPQATHHTAPIFPAAQSYVSFARSKGVAEQSVNRDLASELAVLDQIYQVREHMQHLMNQVDLIQAELEQTVYPAQRLVPLHAAKAPSYTVSSVEPLRAVTAQAADVWDHQRVTA